MYTRPYSELFRASLSSGVGSEIVGRFKTTSIYKFKFNEEFELPHAGNSFRLSKLRIPNNIDLNTISTLSISLSFFKATIYFDILLRTCSIVRLPNATYIKLPNNLFSKGNEYFECAYIAYSWIRLKLSCSDLQISDCISLEVIWQYCDPHIPIPEKIPLITMSQYYFDESITTSTKIFSDTLCAIAGIFIVSNRIPQRVQIFNHTHGKTDTPLVDIDEEYLMMSISHRKALLPPKFITEVKKKQCVLDPYSVEHIFQLYQNIEYLFWIPFEFGIKWNDNICSTICIREGNVIISGCSGILYTVYNTTLNTRDGLLAQIDWTQLPFAKSQQIRHYN